MGQRIPAVGRWFQDLETGEIFEVVAVDDHARSIELQFTDGELSEYDFDSWRELQLIAAAAPEDSRASYEMSDEDNWDPDRTYRPEDWSGPLSSIEPDLFQGSDEI